MLRVEALHLRRGGQNVLAAPDFEAGPGEAVVLLGRNGAGKSSLLRALAGLLRPAAGRVCWNGADVADDPAAHNRRLRWVGHGDAAKPGLTARENLGFLAELVGGDADAALRTLGLGAMADLPARVLSAGQRRRLALARLALAPAALWLLDEPTVGLDASAVARLEPMLARHRNAGGIVVAATHLPLPLRDARELAL